MTKVLNGAKATGHPGGGKKKTPTSKHTQKINSRWTADLNGWRGSIKHLKKTQRISS